MEQIPQDDRASLCEQLLRYIGKHPENEENARRVLDFVCSTPDCFRREHRAGHITGSAWLLNPDGSKALLTLHHKLQIWVQPGGHADGDPNILRVACREAEEESGITGVQPLSTEIYDVDIHTIPARPASHEPQHLHYDIRYLLKAPHEHYSISDESDALGWYERGDITHLTPPADAATIRLCSLWPMMTKDAATENRNLGQM